MYLPLFLRNTAYDEQCAQNIYGKRSFSEICLIYSEFSCRTTYPKTAQENIHELVLLKMYSIARKLR